MTSGYSLASSARLNVQLIDVETGAHLWSNRYDRVLTDAFSVQAEVTGQIVMLECVRLTRSD